jgi:amino acid adenylation domain-containing protein
MTMVEAPSFPPAEWNETAREYPALLLHEAFEAQVARAPDAIALRFRDSVLTYRELNDHADDLARRLAALGAGPNSLVAVCMERSLEMVVALYATLKAGAAYVPIDPEYPADRIEFMVEDTAAPILVTQPAIAGRFDGAATQVIALDLAAAVQGEGEHSPVEGSGRAPAKPTLDDLAYVIYTSGSTGKPKGAMNTHRGIVNRIFWMQEAFGLTPDDRVIQKTPFSFDVAGWEFFWPLLFGAQLVIAEPGGHRDSSYLAELIMERGITTIHFVPSMLQLFLEDPRAGACTSLRRVICSGEALPKAVQDRFFSRLDAELHNLYGPTEAAIDVTWWACDPASTLAFVPIGKPVANTQMHVVDESLQPVPVGTAGELIIGGVQVGRGYLNRPELTAERFIDDHLSGRPGARLYRTGDLARYLPDGNIEFLGRSDFQVKIRGFRVELGEIEAALEAIPGVRQAVVMARERAGGDKDLVAYVSQADGSAQANEALRATLLERLPAYMVPTTFVQIERFPLSPNGKVDRKALPAPTRARPELGTPFAPPRSKLERLIAEIWQDVLDVDAVGVDDRFFELGGTSLQAARFVNEMQTRLHEQIFVVSLFGAPSVAEYAAFLQEQYPASVARLVGSDVVAVGAAPRAARITEGDVARLQAAVPRGDTSPEPGAERNPPAIFILSPPRSGTTLLRIMLAGHRDLFSASELQLLGFGTMRERADAYTGRFSGWLDGLIRSVMEIEGLDADAAKASIRAAEAEGVTTKAFYRRLQDEIRPRLLVDKSPSYAMDPGALRKAEADFDGALYIHLVRDPVPMIESFARHHMDQVLHIGEHPFGPRQLAELLWTISHRNIGEFLAGVPPERWVRIRFEELVTDPATQMESLCRRLGLPFDPGVLQPYEGVESKMVDGVYPESAPMGDPNFLARGRIDPSTAQAGARSAEAVELGAPTIELATSLGYDVGSGGDADDRRSRRASFARQRELRMSGRRRDVA